MNSFLSTIASFTLETLVPAIEKASPAIKNIIGAVVTVESGGSVPVQLPWGLGTIVLQRPVAPSPPPSPSVQSTVAPPPTASASASSMPSVPQIPLG